MFMYWGYQKVWLVCGCLDTLEEAGFHLKNKPIKKKKSEFILLICKLNSIFKWPEIIKYKK